MAVRDVKEYYYKLLAQYVEMKEDLADWEKALQDGFVTEEQVADVKNDIAAIQTNVSRLHFIMMLLDEPNRKQKKVNYKKQHKKILDKLKQEKATDEDVIQENKEILDRIKEELTEITK